VGPGGYQVGAFPPGWAEWNDRFRDTARAFWKGDEGITAEMATRMSASGDLFNKRGRKPWASVNLITAHDGFTLNDVVSYNDKHNEANGEDGRDGSSDNRSWNCGAEGPTDDADVLELRQRQTRNLLATLLLAQGTPMLVAGDEFGRSQQGNNNAYCQDNEISWVDWDINDAGTALTGFVRRLTELRHRYPILRRGRFLTGEYNEDLGIKDVAWINASGAEMTDDDWASAQTKCFGMLMDGRAQATGIRRPASDATLLLILNAYHDVVAFALPEVAGGRNWALVFDTNQPDRVSDETFVFGEAYEVTGRSTLMFALQPGPSG
jgi:glycogen operon protein